MEMGRPEMPNTFAKIQKASAGSEAKGDVLNRLSGMKDATKNGIKYVDAKTHNKMGKDEFLKLLTHQLAHQDPMNPMDQKQFSGELAQFASLEQMTAMNTSLTKMQENSPTEGKFYGASFLGKKVVTSGTHINVKGEGDEVDVPFSLPQNAKNMIVRIMDSKGQLIKQIDKENVPAGSQSVRWDGRFNDDTPSMKGSYSVEVLAWDETMMPFRGETKSTGVVTGVFFEGGETIFELDRQKRVFLKDVDSFQVNDKIKNESVGKEQMVNSYAKNKEASL